MAAARVAAPPATRRPISRRSYVERFEHGGCRQSVSVLEQLGWPVLVYPGSIAAIEQGSVFGEQAFLDGQPRSATVNAVSECEVRSLASKDYLRFREKPPHIACKVLADIGRTLSLRGRRQLRELQFPP